MLLIGHYPFVSSQAQDLDTPFGGLVSLALIIFHSLQLEFLALSVPFVVVVRGCLEFP